MKKVYRDLRQPAGTRQILELVSLFAKSIPDWANRDEVQMIIDNREDPFWQSIAKRFKPLFDEMIERGNYDQVSGLINYHNFPGADTAIISDKLELIRLAEVQECQRGKYKHASIFELLDYGAKDPDKQRRQKILACGSRIEDDEGNMDVPCLGASGRGSNRSRTLEMFRIKVEGHFILEGRVDAGLNEAVRVLMAPPSLPIGL